MGFFTTLYQSITSPKFYEGVRQKSFGSALGYILVLMLFLTLVTLSGTFQAIFRFDLGKTIRDVSSLYPADLTMTVSNGQFFINKPLPYTIAMPEELQRSLENQKESTPPASLVVFATDDDVKNIAGVRKYNTFALVTESTLYFLKDASTGEIRAYPIPRTEHAIQLSRSTIDSMLVRVTEMPLIKSRLWTPLAALVLFAIVYPAMVIGILFSLLFLSLVSFLLAKIFFKSTSVSYGTTYKMAMFAQTPLLILNTATRRFMGSELLSGFVYLLVITAWMLFLVSQFPTKSSLTKKKVK